MKYLRVFLLAVMVAAAVMVPLRVAGDSGIRLVGSTASVDFPLRLTFSTEAIASQPVRDVRLHYRVARRSFVDVISEVKLEYPPSTRVNAQYTLDMRRVGGYPPGTAVYFWWTVTDVMGDTTQSEAQRVTVNDDRYAWQDVSQGMITLHWYRGNRAFGNRLLVAAEEAVLRLTRDAGTTLEEPIDIYVYGDSQDLRGAMVFANEWTGGRAYPDFDAIVIGIAPRDVAWGENAVAHEIGHLVVHQLSDNPFIFLPIWLNEGLAMTAQPNIERDSVQALLNARDEGTLQSVRSLSSPFSADSTTVTLSYAQSWSVVQYLSQEYGQDRINQMLRRFSQGIGYDALLLEVYGFDRDELDRRWRAAVAAGTAPGFD